MTRRAPPLLLTALLVFAPAIAAGQAPSPAPAAAGEEATAAEVRALFLEGHAHQKAARWAEAERAYAAAWSKKKTHDLAANLGLVSMELKKYGQAAASLAFALRNYPAGGSPTKRADMEHSFQQAKAQAGALEISVSLEGAKVIVNGVDQGRSPMMGLVFIDAGPFAVEAQQTGYVTARRTGTVEKAKTAGVHLEMVPEKVAAPVPTGTATATATSGPAPFRSAVPVFVLGGAAVVAAGVGIGLNVVAAAEDASVKQAADSILASKKSCVAGAANFDSRCVELETQARNGQTLGGLSVGLLVGAGLVAGGALLYWFLPGAPPMKLGAVVVPEGGRVSAAMSVGGEF